MTTLNFPKASAFARKHPLALVATVAVAGLGIYSASPSRDDVITNGTNRLRNCDAFIAQATPDSSVQLASVARLLNVARSYNGDAYLKESGIFAVHVAQAIPTLGPRAASKLEAEKLPDIMAYKPIGTSAPSRNAFDKTFYAAQADLVRRWSPTEPCL